MTLQQLAAQIPGKYRRAILNKNLIVKAQAVAGNDEMYELFVYWKDYLEPTIEPACNMCFARVLDGFRKMQDILIELEKESELLNEV
jgi:hypothetical protein